MTTAPLPNPSAVPGTPSTGISAFGRWMALVAALLGWLFDGAEMGLFSQVGRPAIQDLLGFGAQLDQPQKDAVALYFGIVLAMFLVGAATGGVLFGWLGDRIGRVRAMSLSVLTYAVFTGFCGFAQTPLQLAILRCIASLGMGGEWALGVALVMEVWPNRSRGLMAGLIGAAANVGYMLVGFIGLGLAAMLTGVGRTLLDWGLKKDLVDSLVAFGGWRLLMILGTTPALLTFFFRLFVPESEKWQHEQDRGTTSNWKAADLLGVLLGALGPALIVWVWSEDWSVTHPDSLFATNLKTVRFSSIGVGLVVATIGYTYPMLRFVQRLTRDSGNPQAWRPILGRMLLAALLAGIALLGTWASAQWAAKWAGELTASVPGSTAPQWTQIWSALGACVGTIVAALACDRFGRRITYFFLCVLSLSASLWFYVGNSAYDSKFLFSVFLLGATTASFYGWLPLYLPELFGTAVRATGQGFGFNFGRILAAIGALQAGVLTAMFPKGFDLIGVHVAGGLPAACSTMSLVYVLGLLVIWLAPETRGKPLPE
ncbi:MAG: MFS transporter [Planctomycetota bacterium]|nr:MFS transporter [Planctomycetota bacterium]